MTFPPFVSVIVLNYNGERFLPACLDALRMQSYPKDRFEVIVADNGSTDGSLRLLREIYPWVRVHETGGNLGFAGGNNAAIAIARGEHVVLLNNDTAPAHDWLEQLITVAEQHPRAGIVTGRMRLFYDQLEVKLCCDHELHVFDIDAGLPLGVVQYLDGFGGWEFDACGARFRRMRSSCGIIGVPVPHGPSGFSLHLRLAAQPAATATVCADGQTLARIHLVREPRNLRLEIPSSIAATAKPVMQNAGSVLFADGHSRDRGIIVKHNEALYETDRDQFNMVEEVFAGCGGNMLLRRAMLNDVGLLDDDFFMYYEDTDLSWRARLRGWQVLYAPAAIVRHVHCGSSQEWSPLFLFNVERNRLAMLIKNGAPHQVMGEFIRYAGWATRSLVESSAAALLAQPGAHERRARALLSMRVVGSLVSSLPSLLRKRAYIQRTRITPQREIEKWFQVARD